MSRSRRQPMFQNWSERKTSTCFIFFYFVFRLERESFASQYIWEISNVRLDYLCICTTKIWKVSGFNNNVWTRKYLPLMSSPPRYLSQPFNLILSPNNERNCSNLGLPNSETNQYNTSLNPFGGDYHCSEYRRRCFDRASCRSPRI